MSADQSPQTEKSAVHTRYRLLYSSWMYSSRSETDWWIERLATDKKKNRQTDKISPSFLLLVTIWHHRCKYHYNGCWRQSQFSGSCELQFFLCEMSLYFRTKEQSQNTAQQNYPGSSQLLWHSARKQGEMGLFYNAPEPRGAAQH